MINLGVYEMYGVEPSFAGIDVHKMQSLVSLRLCNPAQAQPLSLTYRLAV